ncbi:MAG TPA: c-type cytochrome [Flavisolibacter sp.]|jgi:cytochrome c|nr:c-type cytochrome [Flavisolibacter sp.]
MKKTILIVGIIAAIAGCGSNETKTATAGNTDASTESKPADLSSNPDYQKGLALIGKSDCLTCHKIDETATGPAYVAVAKKYADQPGIEDSLAQKIIKGGGGVWGNIAMTPHPQLSQEDAKAMVKYILLLNKQ